MVDLAISALPPVTRPLAGTELGELVQGGANKQFVLSDVLEYVIAAKTTRILTTVGPIDAVETVVASLLIPANTLIVGSTFRIEAFGLHTNTTTATTGIYRCRIGAATLSGNAAARLDYNYGTTARTDGAFCVRGLVTVRAIGASGSAIGGITTDQSSAFAQTAGVTAPVAVDTTVANLIELTYASGGVTTSEKFLTAIIERQ